MNLFQGQGYFSAGLKLVFKPPWIFPLFIFWIFFPMNRSRSTKSESVVSILLSAPFLRSASSIFQHSAAGLYSACLFLFQSCVWPR